VQLTPLADAWPTEHACPGSRGLRHTRRRLGSPRLSLGPHSRRSVRASAMVVTRRSGTTKIVSSPASPRAATRRRYHHLERRLAIASALGSRLLPPPGLRAELNASATAAAIRPSLAMRRTVAGLSERSRANVATVTISLAAGAVGAAARASSSDARSSSAVGSSRAIVRSASAILGRSSVLLRLIEGVKRGGRGTEHLDQRSTAGTANSVPHDHRQHDNCGRRAHRGRAVRPPSSAATSAATASSPRRTRRPPLGRWCELGMPVASVRWFELGDYRGQRDDDQLGIAAGWWRRCELVEVRRLLVEQLLDPA